MPATVGMAFLVEAGATFFRGGPAFHWQASTDTRPVRVVRPLVISTRRLPFRGAAPALRHLRFAGGASEESTSPSKRKPQQPRSSRYTCACPPVARPGQPDGGGPRGWPLAEDFRRTRLSGFDRSTVRRPLRAARRPLRMAMTNSKRGRLTSRRRSLATPPSPVEQPTSGQIGRGSRYADERSRTSTRPGRRSGWVSAWCLNDQNLKSTAGGLYAGSRKDVPPWFQQLSKGIGKANV